MKNTFAIGIPDKVGRAERDGEVHNKYKKALQEILAVDGESHVIDFYAMKAIAKDALKEKVIEFDLPKGYSAEDAFIKGMIMCNSEHNGIPRMYKKFLDGSTIKHHFKIKDYDYWISKERANLYLLLAVANGHKLE